MLTFLAPLFLAAHVCPIPRVAYQTDRTPARAEYRRLEQFGSCVCGSDPRTDIDYDVYLDPRESRYRFHPSCDRERIGYLGFHPRRQVGGFNGHAYKGER